MLEYFNINLKKLNVKIWEFHVVNEFKVSSYFFEEKKKKFESYIDKGREKLYIYKSM